METISYFSRRITLAVVLLLAAFTARGQGVWNYNGPLYSFGQRANAGDGASPNGGVIVDTFGTTMYGTTYSGGKFGKGTIFALDLLNNQLQTVWDFGNIARDGANPQGNLVLANGTLYGTTQLGGANNEGVVYSVSVTGQNYALLRVFGSVPGDGSIPTFAGLTLSQDGATLYGTTSAGGSAGQGTVFAVSTTLGGPSSTLHQFTVGFANDGAMPEAGLILSLDGQTLYGTTAFGGDDTTNYGDNGSGFGTVFALSTAGDVNGSYQVLYRFANTVGDVDGEQPVAGLILSADGTTLYGTTGHGGQEIVYGNQFFSNPNGTVFSIGTTGANYAIINRFEQTPNNIDGICPFAGLALAGPWLFGTTFYGGVAPTSGQGSGNNFGTVFAVNTNGAANPNGPPADYQLYGFGDTNNDGAYPASSLTYQNASPYPILYGTTAAGGQNGLGTLFSLTEVTPPMMSIIRQNPLSVQIDNNDATLTYTLQSSPSLHGPWINVAQGVNSYIDTLSNLHFYRMVAMVSNAPVVATMPAMRVSANDAMLVATVVPNAPYAIAWFQYGTDTTYQGGMSPTTVVGADMANAMMRSHALTGLQPGTTYHYQLVASNLLGVTYGADQSFSTFAGATAPAAVTTAAVGVTSNTATLTGTVNPNGANTRAYFQYGLDTGYGNQTSETVIDGSDTNNAGVSNAVAMLSPGTVYHFQLVAENDEGTNYGGDQVFATLGPPGATTAPASAVMANSATLNGYVLPNDANTVAWFEYGLDTNYTGGITAMIPVSDTNIEGLAVSSALSGLASNTVYHFQLVASNSAGVSYGGDEYFTTPLGPLPQAVTGAASNITTTTALLTGTVNPEGIATGAFFFYYSPTTGAYGFTGAVPTGSGAGPVNISATVTGLAPGDVYYFEIVATNTVGNGAAYGIYNEFMTANLPVPTAQTLAANSLGTNSAQLNGSVNPNGASTTYYFQYGTTTSYGSITTQSSAGAGTTAENVNATPTGLASYTTYHYRLVANNSGGTGLGADETFTTVWQPVPPTLVSPGATTTGGGGALIGTLTPTMTWSGASQASSSDLILTEYPYGSGNVVATFSVSGASYQIPGGILQAGTDYDWYMVSFNSLGDESTDSGPLYFQTANAPTAQTEAAQDITGSGATLEGSVTPDGADTTVYFQYGLTTGYGSSTSPQNIGTNSQAVSAAVTGLASYTTYHYRLVATNGIGAAYGGDTIVVTY